MLDISQPAHEASLDSLDPEHLAVTPVNLLLTITLCAMLMCHDTDDDKNTCVPWHLHSIHSSERSFWSRLDAIMCALRRRVLRRRESCLQMATQ